MAYEIKIKRCDCGKERKIKSAPRGVWWKGIDSHPEKVGAYPTVWKKVLKSYVEETVRGDKTVTLDRLGRSGLPWAEVEDMIQNLLSDGIVEKFEKYPKRTLRDVRIVIPNVTIQSLRKLLGCTKKEEDEEAVDAFFRNWEKMDIPGAIPAGIEIDRLAELWKANRKPVIPLRNGPVTLRSLSNYKLLLDALKTITFFYLKGGTIAFRELSVKVSGSSKGLAAIKDHLKGLLGNLEDHGITEHSPLLLCRIPVAGDVNGHPLDLSAAEDYVALTLKTTEAFRFAKGSVRVLLLVENLTTFERTVPLLPQDIGILWLAGYPPGHVRKFVRNLLRFHPVPGAIWCDLDPDGVEIALTAGRWFEEAGKSWHPVGMDKDVFLKIKRSRRLEDRDKKKIKDLKKRPGMEIFHELLEVMEETGEKKEQEGVDNNFPILQKFT